VVIIVPKFKSERMNRMILNKRARNFKIHLDSLGSEVWLHIDGHTKVRDICNQLTEKLGDSIQPAEQRITKFLTMLYEARYISFLEIEEEKQQLS
jgi:exonuclease I